jgi:hypothetical protein
MSPKIKYTSPRGAEGQIRHCANVNSAFGIFSLIFSILSLLFSLESRLKSYYDGHGTGKVVYPDPALALDMQVKSYVQESAELLSSVREYHHSTGWE